jgi:hypothetical protein
MNSCHIDPHGKLGVCMISRAQEYDLRRGIFEEGWHEFLHMVRYNNLLINQFVSNALTPKLSS